MVEQPVAFQKKNSKNERTKRFVVGTGGCYRFQFEVLKDRVQEFGKSNDPIFIHVHFFIEHNNVLGAWANHIATRHFF